MGPSEYQYFGSLSAGVLGYADFCPMFYHYSNGDCRIIESSHKYESFGADICPQCKCNELYSSNDDSKNYAICYETSCAQNYLYSNSDNDKSDDFYFDINDFSDYTAVRIKISNEDYSKYEYVTCWSFESGQFKETAFYSYFIKCPQFEDICYAKNPWSCNGHGMINTESESSNDECFCNHGYIGCDCTIRDTLMNRANADLIAETCKEDGDVIYVNSNNFDNDAHDGTMPFNEDDVDWKSLGLLNITMQTNEIFLFENVLRTLRLWIAINVKIKEENVWIQSYEALKNSHTHSFAQSGSILDNQQQQQENNVNYSVAIAYYDDQNQNKICPDLLITEFHYLFNSKVSAAQIEANENEFILYDIYNIKQPESSSKMLTHSFIVLFCILFLCLIIG